MAKLVETDSNRGAIQPGLDVFDLGMGRARPLQQDLHGEFLCARGVANDAPDYPGYARILSVKDFLDIRPAFAGFGLNESLGQCVHGITTPPIGIL
jgi:hypothetical protein